MGEWLRYDPLQNQSGLLPVHIASIAHDSPDLFLLLLTFAKRPAADWQIPEVDRAKCLQAMITVVHWFGRNKPAIAHCIFAACAEHISRVNIQSALAEALEKRDILPVHAPEAIKSFFDKLPEPNLLNWNWVQLGHEAKPEEERQKVWNRWGEFLRFKDQKEMLLYAQRDFLNRQFKDYDPARKDFWKGHNRPWDFDHILARFYIHSKQGDHKTVCGEWLNTIGNFRAWPMEDNRSQQDETALVKLSEETGSLKCRDSFLEKNELPAFSQKHETRKTPEAATAFVTACRDRMLRIYDTWYVTVGVAQLIPGAGDPELPENSP